MLPSGLGLHFGSSRYARWGLIVGLWIGANCVAIHCCDVYDSNVFEAKFHLPARVIREYCEGQCSVRAESESPQVLWYRFRPPPMWKRSQSIPLVVYLHGAGERGFDNVQQLRALPSLLCNEAMADAFPCAVLAPQCPHGMNWLSRLNPQIDMLDAVMRMVDTVTVDGRIDPKRIYLIGLSMGGFGSWALAARFPERFAAVVPICGGGDTGQAPRLVSVPIWAVHGNVDDVVPVTHSQAMISAIEEAGGSPRFWERADVGHNSWDAVFRVDSDVLRWMFRQSQEK